MSTYLLTWNPKDSPWDEFPEQTEGLRRGKPVLKRWSCGVTRRIRPGDRVFLLRQGVEPRGILGMGTVEEGSFEKEHWNPDKTGMALYVKARWSVLSETPIIPRVRLDEPPFQGVRWNTQSSGISIPDHVGNELEALIGKAGGWSFASSPDEVASTVLYPEGALQRVVVNAYERNPAARAACIAHYGATCSVCTLDFGRTYGPDAEGVIHVHHLKEISTLGKGYEIDPIRDLRPVCPNCHAVIHRKNPAYPLDTVKEMLHSMRFNGDHRPVPPAFGAPR